MREEKPRTRRVVSKRAYAAHQGKKAVIIVAVLFAVLMAMIVMAVMSLSVGFRATPIDTGENAREHVLFLLLIGTICLFACWYLAYIGIRQVQKMPPVVPITRHNTGDLPEEETLIRASEEPPTQQADVLLRAAQSHQETPVEQLLRPVEK